MAARIQTVCDAVAAAIAAGLAPGDTTVVNRTHAPPVDVKSISGRRAYVFGLDYGQADTLTRGEDLAEYGVGILVVEKYTDAGDPTDTWTDTRAEWVEAYVYDLLSGARTAEIPAAIAALGLYPETAQVQVVADAEMLLEKKLFWSLTAVTFRRDE